MKKILFLLTSFGLLSTIQHGRATNQKETKKVKLHPTMQAELDKNIDNPYHNPAEVHPKLMQVLNNELNDPDKTKEIHDAVDAAHAELEPQKQAALAVLSKKRARKNKKSEDTQAPKGFDTRG
jgi:hypothetical protein